MHSFLSAFCSIDLGPLFEAGSLPETVHKVVKDEEYCGEIKVALTFTPEVMLESFFPLFFFMLSCLSFSPFR